MFPCGGEANLDSTQKLTATYVSRYLNDCFGLEICPDDLLRKYPWHRIVWYHFFAYAYYKEKNYYESWDEVPDPVEGMTVNIISLEVLDRFQYRKGVWHDLGSATADCWK